MKKLNKLFAAIFTGSMLFSFASCDIFGAVATDIKEFIGDPVGETCLMNCGIPHDMQISGTINGKECGYIELIPLEKAFYAYSKKGGQKIYRGSFFYQENPDNYDEGTFWVEVGFIWDSNENEWSTPSKYFNGMAYNENHFMSTGVNLTTEVGTIAADTLVTSDEYYAAKDELSKYVLALHSGDDDPTGITKESLIAEITQERYTYLEIFEEALKKHDASKTTVEYVKKNGVYTYVALIDGSELELMIFTGDGQLFFYPINEKTEHDYMMGMYAYNRSNKKQRRWIRENFTNIGSLYDELKEKAAAAKELVKGSNE